MAARAAPPSWGSRLRSSPGARGCKEGGTALVSTNGAGKPEPPQRMRSHSRTGQRLRSEEAVHRASERRGAMKHVGPSPMVR